MTSATTVRVAARIAGIDTRYGSVPGRVARSASRRSGTPPRGSLHPAGEPRRVQEPGALAVRADGDLPCDRSQEMPVERITWERAHHPGANVLDQLEADAPDVQCGGAVQQDGNDAVIERHLRLHVEHDRPVSGRSFCRRESLAHEKPSGIGAAGDLETVRIPWDPGQTQVMEQ